MSYILIKWEEAYFDDKDRNNDPDKEMKVKCVNIFVWLPQIRCWMQMHLQLCLVFQHMQMYMHSK